MLGQKYEIADLITLGAAEYLYEHGIALVATDGKYVQMDDEKHV